MGPRRFITVSTTARNSSLSYATWIQPTPSHPSPLRPTIRPPSSLHPGTPSGLSPSGSQPKPRRPRHFCSMPSHACHILRPSDLNRTLLFAINSLRPTHTRYVTANCDTTQLTTKHTLFLQDRGLTLEETSFTQPECPCITRGCICQLPTYFISSSLVLLVRCLDLVSSHKTQADCTRSEHLLSKVRLIKTNTLQLTWLPATKP